jgi:hypothetical protein
MIGLRQHPVLQDLRRRDPALRQPAPAGGSRISLESALSVLARLLRPRRRGISRLGQMRPGPGSCQLPGHITPPGARLNGERHPAHPGDPLQPGPQMPPVSRGDLPALHLPRHHVQVIERDLLPVMSIPPAIDGIG